MTQDNKEAGGAAIKSPKKGGKPNVIINPPEKLDPTRTHNEAFKKAYDRFVVAIEQKVALVLQAKANKAHMPEEVIQQVFIRGYKDLPLNTDLTREQYAMNRVNSFIAFGEAFIQDCELLERIGLKGSGGAMRPHIKTEKSPYNNKVIYHVVDKAGHVKHSTSDQFAAKRHLAGHYNAYNEAREMKGEDPCWDDYKMVGTKKKNGKEVPNCVPEEVELDEVSDQTLKNYTKGAMHDTISGKKDRNAGMKKAFSRLAGLNKPIMQEGRMKDTAPDNDLPDDEPIARTLKSGINREKATQKLTKLIDKSKEMQRQRIASSNKAQGVAVKEEAEQILEYGDTAKGQKMLAKVQKRAVDRLIKADDKNRLEPDVAKRDLKTVKKNATTAQRAYDRMEEEAEQIDELKDSTLQSYQAKRGNPEARRKTALDSISKFFSDKRNAPGKPDKHQVHTAGLNRAREKLEKSRIKQTAMNPQKPRPAPKQPTGFRSGAMDDTYGT